MDTIGLNLSLNGKRISDIWALVALILTFCCVVPASAQFTSSSLNGTIVDPSGSVVAGARVTAKNEATGFSQTVSSSSIGSYTFPTLPIGTYLLTIEAPGFSAYSQSGIVLTVNQVATQNVTLEVGSVSQSVSVTSQAPLLTTTSATVGQLVSRQQVVNLPLNGRTVGSLLYVGAGAVNTTGNGYCAYNCIGGTFPAEQYATLNGGINGGVVYLLDGANFNDWLLDTNLPFPNPDAIQEFNTQVSNMSAQFGYSVGGVVDVVTKSGTNQIHGDVFEFLRNGDFDAKNYFATAADTLKRNQFGFTLGGPLIKNKLFYFGSYQGTRESTAAGGEIAFVPTAQERTGDFSDVSVQLVNPVTGAYFPNNQVPVSPVSAYFLKDLPLPNGSGRQVTFVGPPVTDSYEEYLAKIDYQRNKQLLSGHYFFSNFGSPTNTSKTNLLLDTGGQALRLQSVSVNYVYTASPRLLFSTWYALNDESGQSTNGAPYGPAAAGVNMAEPGSPTIDLDVGGAFNISTGYYGDFVRRFQEIREDMTWIRGPHEFHFGGSFGYLSAPKTNQYGQGGSFSFDGALTGDNVADFIFGQLSDFNQSGGLFYDFTQNRYGLFAQDNWHAMPRLTMQLGLRWDPYLPYYDSEGRLGCYEPGKQSVRYPNAPLGLLYGGSNHDAGCPAGAINRDWNNLEPRVGFAYKPNTKGQWSVRGGVGLYLSIPSIQAVQTAAGIAPFAPSIDLTDVSFADPFGSAGVPNPFPAQFGPLAPGPDVTFTVPVNLKSMLPRNFVSDRVLQWNLTIERQFGQSWLASIAYVGSKGTHLSSAGSAEGGSEEVNPAVYIPGQSTHGNTQQRRIDPDFSHIDESSSNHYSNYDALQAELRKRLNHGLSFNFNFTWAKNLDDWAATATGTNSVPFDPAFDYGPSPNDVAREINFTPIYQLPQMKGNGWQTRFVNGWTVSSITAYQSGLPYSVFSGVDNSFSGVGQDRADFTGSNLSQAVLNPNRSHSQLVNEYFNTSLFAVNAVGSFGPRGKNYLRAPGYFNMDAAMVKAIPITERVPLQFRVEAFNVFNSVNFEKPGATVGRSSFGKITGATSPRILQLSLKLQF